MSVYSIRGKGWRYDFTRNGQRYTEAWFKTKREAKMAEAEKRKEVLKPQATTQTPTDMGFLELVNRRLDQLDVFCSRKHYQDCRYWAKVWVDRWGHLTCSKVSEEMIEEFVIERSKVSAHTANQELKNLRALFNFAKKKRLIEQNPTRGIEFFPVEKKVRYIPPPRDIEKVISVADSEAQDYLWTIRETMARVSEINRLTWSDTNFEHRYVILYTRKKRGGHLTPRKIPMTARLYEILSRRYRERDPSKPWVFWHRYWSRKLGRMNEGPYGRRKKLMKSLCKKAGVRVFQFHALRHSGASVMENANVPIGAIQRILGHSGRRTTAIYLHSLGDSEREAMAVFDQVSRENLTQSLTQ